MGVLGPTTDKLWSRGLLQIYDRAPQGQLLPHYQGKLLPRYQVMITPEGYKAVEEQEQLRKVWACISIDYISEALVFMKSLYDEELPELLVCGDEMIRNQARRRIEICHGTD